ncbi:LysR substrate-binding domain-containing protein [Sinomonas terrae]|uniref:LysR substrate-binding domain-containing protein n=1 Tax=Sinomonas terrae TaxID=2908838 RepID=A0ABS9U0Q0_9MICC|nr:LysR substrate-binding domain-containing protein [Sinomonas terrae]MCH6470171.1 LysR substrate-binding domain-containing protein [Sinomonas terrae]
METRRLRYFVTIVDSGTITRAAELLHIAQPALSQHVSALESEFKQQLLLRSRRGIVPTAAGRSLYRYAQSILRLENEAHHEIDSEVSSPSGTVTIGLATYSLASSLTIPILQAIRLRYPRIVMRIVETLTVIHSQAIRMGQIDAALVYDPGPIHGVNFERISTDPLVLISAADLEIPGATEDSVPVPALAELEFILPNRTHTLRSLMEQTLSRAGLELKVVVEMEHSRPLGDAVGLGLGVTVLPLPAAEARFAGEGFRLRRITDPGLTAGFALATPDHEATSAAADVVVQTLREMLLGPDSPWTTPAGTE